MARPAQSTSQAKTSDRTVQAEQPDQEADVGRTFEPSAHRRASFGPDRRVGRDSAEQEERADDPPNSSTRLATLCVSRIFTSPIRVVQMPSIVPAVGRMC